ncbi:hypothetical protein BJ138DRAFT_977415, partial [Hygrophoropsis aurantiaca]
QLCDSVARHMSSIPWAGEIHGFSQFEPILTLATYLSSDWLSDAHIDQQLDLLRHDLSRQMEITGCEVVRTSFFRKLLSVFLKRSERDTYSGGNQSCRQLWSVGEELSSGNCSRICGVVNINDSHWIALAIDFVGSTVYQGDSMGNIPYPELGAAVDWWIFMHAKRAFQHMKLAISRQQDMVSCGVFALNAVAHYVLPNSNPVLQHKDVDEARLSFFVRVVDRSLDLVR